jgi:Concanavalin A-like lectin/glucanases superfamily
LTKRLLFLALLLSTPLFAQSVGCGGVPGAIAQIGKNGCGGVPGAGGGAKGLPEHWPMHDGSGDTFADATPNDNTITAKGITWGTGTGVTSPTFNGSTSTGVAAQAPITDFDGTTPFSVSLWVNTSSVAAQILVGTCVNSSNLLGWCVYTDDTNASFLIANNVNTNVINVNVDHVTPLPSSTTNLIVTYDGSMSAQGVAIYFNGVPQAINIISNTLTASAASGVPLQVGSSADSTGKIDFFAGSMSNLKIVGHVFSTDEIAAIQVAGP